MKLQHVKRNRMISKEQQSDAHVRLPMTTIVSPAIGDAGSTLGLRFTKVLMGACALATAMPAASSSATTAMLLVILYQLMLRC